MPRATSNPALAADRRAMWGLRKQQGGVGRRETGALPLGALGGDPRPRCDRPSDEPPAATPAEPTRRRSARWRQLHITGGQWSAGGVAS